MNDTSNTGEANVVIGVCRRLEPVFRRAAEGVAGVGVRAFEPACEQPFADWQSLDVALGAPGPGPTVVLGGPCLGRLAAARQPPPAFARWKLVATPRCAAVVTGADALALLDAFGVALVVPGENAGRDAVPAGPVAVLDAGEADSVAAAAAGGARVYVPDAALLRERLARHAAERRFDAQQARLNSMLGTAYQQMTERGLTVDYVGGLAEMLVEERAIERFFDLVTLLLAPRRMAYVAIEGGRPTRTTARPPGSYAPGEAQVLLGHFEHNIQWDGAARARLALRHRGRVLGAVEIDGIGRPDRREAVIDLVLTAARIAGLAVSNARLYCDLRGPDRAHAGYAEDLQDALAARKSAEERQAQLSRELEEANHELQQFAYVVSHDLKAPLRGVDSLANWLAQDFGDRMGSGAQEHIGLMLAQVARMRALIDGILQYSRAGRSREERTEVDLSVLVPEVIDMLAPPAHISVEIEGRLPTVVAERTRIEQVFANLLSNAIKYNDKPQGRVSVGCADEGDEWRFSVSDNGPGIRAEDHERIFGLFQTGQPRDEVDSTGIGLSVVKRVVTMFGGRVWLDSVLGQGTTFCFTWPKADERKPEAQGREDDTAGEKSGGN
ncbi:MAG: ATP-binding protein [bacterium]